MAEYKEADDKDEALLTGYGTVRGAELKSIYTDISENTPVSEIEKRHGKPNPETGSHETDHISNCMKFLRALDMIEISVQDVVNCINTDIYPELSFEARLLYHIRRQTDRQYHLAEVHEVLMSIDEEDERSGLRAVPEEELLKMVDRKTEYDFKWRPEKIKMWANLLDPIGAVSYDGDEILTSPSRALLYELLSEYKKENKDEELSGDDLRGALEWIDEEFFPVFSSRTGTPHVHIGVADVLSSMVKDDVIEIVSMTDRTDTIELPYSIDNTEEPAEFRINAKPDEAAYYYPLDRTTRRLQ